MRRITLLLIALSAAACGAEDSEPAGVSEGTEQAADPRCPLYCGFQSCECMLASGCEPGDAGLCLVSGACPRGSAIQIEGRWWCGDIGTTPECIDADTSWASDCHPEEWWTERGWRIHVPGE